MRTRRLVVLACFLLTASASGQRVWIADRDLRWGCDFENLPAAVAAAAAGDTIVCRLASRPYDATTIGKSLTLLGERGVPIRGTLVVKGLSAAQAVSLWGLVLASPGLTPGLELEGCAGRIHLQDLTVQADLSQSRPAVRIQGCAGVTAQRSWLSYVEVTSSTIALSECTLRGIPADCGPYDKVSPTPGLRLVGARARLDRGSVLGGDGARCSPSPMAPQPAVASSNSQLVLGGDRTTLFAAGTLLGHAVPGLLGSPSSTLDLDPTVTVVPAGQAPAYEGFLRVTRDRLPSMAMAGGQIGAGCTLILRSPLGSLYGVFVGLPRLPLAAPPLGSLWLDPSTAVLVAFGAQGEAEMVRVVMPLPDDPALRGLAFGSQAVSGSMQRAWLSNPVVLVAR